MSQDNRSLPEGAGARSNSPTAEHGTGSTSSTGSTGTTGTTGTSHTTYVAGGTTQHDSYRGDHDTYRGGRDTYRDEHESGYRPSGRAVVVSSRDQNTPSMATVAGAALAGALAGAAIPFMFAGRSSGGSRTSGRNERSSGRNEDTRVVESVIINKPARQLYDFWRDFTNLPQFMDNIESVQKLDEKRSHWKIKAPAGTSVEFDSFVTEDVPGRSIAWQSEEGASVPNRGRVEFIETGGSTTVRVTIDYEPPAGTVGRIAAKLFQREPSVQAREDLDRLKRLMESGSSAA